MKIRIFTYGLVLQCLLELSSAKFVHQCTFSEPGMCGFKQSFRDDINWTKQRTLSRLVGLLPPVGRTFPTRQSGPHLCACYIEEQPRERMVSVNAIIETPLYNIRSATPVRLALFYYFKERDQSALHVKKMEFKNGRPHTGTLLWSGNGLTFGVGWKKFDIEFHAANSFKIIFEAVATAIEYNSVRIDEYNLIIQNGGHIHPTQPGFPNAGQPYNPPARRPLPPPAAPRPRIPLPVPKPRPTVPVKPMAPKPQPTIGQPKRKNPSAAQPPRRATVRPQPAQPPRVTDFYRPTGWDPGMVDPTKKTLTTQLTTMDLHHRDSLPSFSQSLPFIAVSIGLGLCLVFMVVTVAWVIRCISRVNTPEYLQKKAMMHQQSDSMRLANSKETSKETQRDSLKSIRSKRSIGSTGISPATPDDCSPLPSPTLSSPSRYTSSEFSAFPGFTPTPSEMQYQWVPMHRYEDIIDGESKQQGQKGKVAAGDEVYQNAPLNNRSAKEIPNPLRTIAEELEAQFRKQGVTLFKKHQNQNVKNHEYVNKNAASQQNTYVCRSETDWVENSIYETGSVANNTKNYERFYRMPTM